MTRHAGMPGDCWHGYLVAGGSGQCPACAAENEASREAWETNNGAAYEPITREHDA